LAEHERETLLEHLLSGALERLLNSAPQSAVA